MPDKEIFAHNMANCPVDEFMQHAYTLRTDVEEFIKYTDLVAIRAEKAPISDDMTEEEKKVTISKHVRDKWERILEASFGENREKTFEIMAKMCFTEVETIKALQPYELNNLALTLLSNSRINDFFTSLRLWGLVNTATT